MTHSIRIKGDDMISTFGRDPAPTGRTVIITALLLFSLPAICLGQYYEERYALLPVGGWNVPGPYSVRGAAMGETVLAVSGPQAGYLNPAALGLSTGDLFAVSGNLARLSYTFRDDYTDTAGSLLARRDRAELDYMGIVRSLGGWKVSAGYSVAQSYDIPDLDLFPYHELAYRQSGRLSMVNLAAARAMSPSLYLGVSMSYYFGDVSRTTTSYMPAESDDVYDLRLDISGVGFNFGIIYRPSDRFAFHLSARPPVTLKMDYVHIYSSLGSVVSEEKGDESIRQPLIVTAGLAVKPLAGLTLTADISYWGWDRIGDYSETSFYRLYPADRCDIGKINTGCEYVFPFRGGDRAGGLALRAGYIFDTQPYAGAGWARDFLTTGLGVRFGKLSIDGAVKVHLGSPRSNLNESYTYYSDTVRLGASYKF